MKDYYECNLSVSAHSCLVSRLLMCNDSDRTKSYGFNSRAQLLSPTTLFLTASTQVFFLCSREIVW